MVSIFPSFTSISPKKNHKCTSIRQCKEQWRFSKCSHPQQQIISSRPYLKETRRLPLPFLFLQMLVDCLSLTLSHWLGTNIQIKNPGIPNPTWCQGVNSQANSIFRKRSVMGVPMCFSGKAYIKEVLSRTVLGHHTALGTPLYKLFSLCHVIIVKWLLKCTTGGDLEASFCANYGVMHRLN